MNRSVTWAGCGLCLAALHLFQSTSEAIGGPPEALPMVAPDAQGVDAEALAPIAPLVEEGIVAGKLPGAVVLIGYRGATIYHRAFGQRQVRPTAKPMQRSTLFDLASLTKPIATATSVMQLVERGVIDLDDRVSEHLPAFGVAGKEEVTVRQLLLHIGGLIPDNAMADYREGAAEAIANFLAVPLNYPPGSKFRYSDVGFQVLGELVREKTGENLATFSQRTIFEPLGMQETGFLPAARLRQRAATTQQREGRWMQGEVHDPRADAMGGVAGHAGLFSTAADLAVYAQMLLGDGTYRGVTILQPKTVRQMTAAYEVPRGTRGLGWDKQTGYSSNRGKTMSPAAFGHGGFTGTAMWIDPALQLFVIFLSNRVHPDGKGSVNALAGEIGTVAADAVRQAEE